MARELMDYGWVFLMLRDYRAGRVSLGTFAHKRDVSLSEAIDLLAEIGVRWPLEYDDYLKGLSTATAFVKGSKAWRSPPRGRAGTSGTLEVLDSA